MGVQAEARSRRRKASPAATPSTAARSIRNGKIIFNTLDGQTIAVDANSGQQVWRTQLGNIQKGETITMAPLVANGKVLVGNSGGEMGVRGWLAALDEGSGKLAWKAYQHRPRQGRADRLRASSPSTPMDQGKDLGVKTWPPEAWKIGGGTVWGWISYDPGDQTIYYGTGNPGPVESPTSGPATTNGRPASSRATSTPAQARVVLPDRRRTTFTTTTTSTRSILADMPWGTAAGRCSSGPARNGFFYVHGPPHRAGAVGRRPTAI